MGARVAVAGASGYVGGELLRLLVAHPDLEIGPVAAASSAGQPVTALHPHLPRLAGHVFVPMTAERLSQADLVFLALPAGESAALAAQLPDQLKVVDLGPDFRLADAAQWGRFYAGPYAGRWTYGLPELPGARERVAAANRVAVPGCYATAAILALAPLLAAGLADPADIVIVAASGTSGAGRAARPDLLGSEVMGSVSAYQVGGAHRHIPEIEQALGEASAQAGKAAPAGTAARAGKAAQAAKAARAGTGAGPSPGVTISFTPLLAPMPRGILATCTARLVPGATTRLAPGAVAALAPGATARSAPGATARPTLDARDEAPADAVRGALAGAYEGEPFVHVLPEGRWPATAATAGSNAAHLQAVVDARIGRAVVVAAIDNLGKGAAGQAVQNANLMLGLPETAGLTANGVAP